MTVVFGRVVYDEAEVLINATDRSTSTTLTNGIRLLTWLTGMRDTLTRHTPPSRRRGTGRVAVAMSRTLASTAGAP
jgi:hypothetical protein